jgi:hypothetical protein
VKRYRGMVSEQERKIIDLQALVTAQTKPVDIFAGMLPS